MYLSLAKKYIAEGDEGRARDIILRHRRDPAGDPEIHFEWGLLCEEIAAFNLARQSYEEALRLSPRNSKYLYRLGRLYADVGNYEKALRYTTQAVKQDPGYIEARRLLAELLASVGQQGSARALRGEKKEQGSPLRYFPPSLSQADIDLFLRLFSGREIGYATQELKADTGQTGWKYHGSPMIPGVVEKHINGEVTLGGLPLRSDNTVKYTTIHIGPYQRIVFRCLKNPSILAELEQQAQEQARKLVAACAAQGISAYLEISGQRGRRVWLFFARFFHFLLVKRFVDRLLEAVPALDSRLVVEPLLATRPVGIGWQEQAILLPLGVDRQTEKRGLFIDDDGIPFSEQLKFIRKIREIDESQVRYSLRNVSIHLARIQEGTGKASLLKALWGKCPVLAELNQKAQSGRKLNNNEKLILFYSLGLSVRTSPCLHDVFEPCPDYNYHKVERMLNQLKPHPISCLKIRSLIPEITASVHCNCTFDLRGGRYPSPFLHIEPQTPLCVVEETFADASLKDLARRYFLLLAKHEEVLRDLRKLEVVIEGRLARKGLDVVQTTHGSLCRVIDGGKPMLVVER